MGIWKKQQPANSPATQQPARPASRQLADDVRSKAQRYTNITEQTGDQSNDRCNAIRQREQAERKMAALRAEALQARRLATQIENLHQPTQVQRKGRIMDTTIADPGQAQRMARRNTDSPSPAGGKLNFNPLHPSMELPPEQLIRLLGLENKTKRRKKRPESVAARERKNHSAGANTANTSAKLSLPTIPPASAERERDTVQPPFEDSHRRLLMPSLVAGAVAGIVISAYLFWSSPEDVVPPATHTAPVSKIENSARRPLPETTKVAPAVAPVETARQGSVTRAKVIPQAEIDSEEKRLHSEAEQRFAERLVEPDIPREQNALGIDTTLPTVTEPAAAGENSTMHYGSPDSDMSLADETGPDVTSTGSTVSPTMTETSAEKPATTPVNPGNEQPGTSASPEPSVWEPQAVTPDNETAPADINTELDSTADTVVDAEPVETVSEDLF